VNDPSLPDLIARRTRIATQIKRLRYQITRLDETIRRLTQERRTRPAGRGLVVRALLTILRKSPEPLDARTLTMRVAEVMGRDCRDPVRFQRMLVQVRVTLIRQRTNGTVTAGEGPALRWRIAG
jgi:hypothetical protein